MTWNSVWPLGTTSVRSNRVTGQQNTSYTETNMNKDHFWNFGVDEDGHHQKIEMPNKLSAVALSTGMNGMYYVGQKPEIQAPDKQITEPFFHTEDGLGGTFQMQLGFKCLVSFIGGSSTPDQEDIKYSFNVQSQPTGVVRQSEGKYKIRFILPMPSNNYIVMGTAFRASSSDSQLTIAVSGNASRSSSMSTTSVIIDFASLNSGNLRDPDFAMISICGG